MVNVKLIDVFTETKKKEFFATSFGKPHTRWFASVALKLVDSSTDDDIAEWFYLIVCSPEYKRTPFRSGPTLDEKYLVVQDEFDQDKVFKIAEQRVALVKAEDWDSFYAQMEKYFLHED